VLSRRAATSEDESFLRALFESVRSEDFAQLPLSEAQKVALIDMQYTARNAQYTATYPSASYEILEDSGAPIGNLTFDSSGPEVRLVDINLVSDQRNRGIGSQVIGELIGVANAQGKSICLHVAATNPALRLYERLGFAPVGQDGLYVQMRKALGAQLGGN
jgi:ribosomal protein S18 acetylase RimI-like enzyme